MTECDLIERFRGITVWKRGGQRAPHKPLLTLLALGHLLREEPRLTPFETVDNELHKLLVDFGPPRKSIHTEYPFWRLQNDGLWELVNAEGVQLRRSNTDAKKSELLRHHVVGGFPLEVIQTLRGNKLLIGQIVQGLLDANFPATVHEDLLDAVGIDLPPTRQPARSRDPEFRERVLRAYGYCCAVCGFDVRLGNTLVALEAAHIKWHQAGGPDTEDNGLALCTLHHKLLDRGVFTLSEAMNVIVSENAHGTQGFKEWVLAFHGQPLRQPQRVTYLPHERFVTWHVREVFRGPRRTP